MGSQGGIRWEFLIPPAITIICKLPVSLIESFQYEDKDSWVFGLAVSLWVLQGFFNSSLGISTAIRRFYSKPQAKEVENDSLSERQQGISHCHTINLRSTPAELLHGQADKIR